MPETPELLFPVPGNQALSFPGSAQIIATIPGKIAPNFNWAELPNSSELLHYWTSWIPTTAPDGNVRVYATNNKSVYRFDNGTRTTDTTFTDTIQHAAIVDNGSGTPVLLVVFGQTPAGTGLTLAHAYRSLTTDTTPWTSVTEGSTKLTAWFVAQVGPMVCAVTGGVAIGRAIFGEHNVSFLAEGAAFEPAANWSTGFPCGHGKWPIINFGAHEDYPVAMTGDGFYAWERVAKWFVNRTTHLKDFLAHAANFKAAVPGENGWWLPTADRKLYFFDGYDVQEETPFREMEQPRDVQLGRIEAMFDSGDSVQAILKAHDMRVMGAAAAATFGLRVFKETNAGVITELTTGVTDGSHSTPASTNMNAWGGAGAAGSWRFVVGSEVPLEGVVLVTSRYANEAVQSFDTPETLNGSGTWVSLGTVVDDTILGTTGISLALTAMPPGFSEPYLGWTSPNAYQLSVRDTYNSISGLYWYSWKNVTTTAMANNDAQGPTIDEVGVIQGRPGLPNKGILSASINHTPRLAAGELSVMVEYSRASRQWAVRGAYNMLGGVTKMGRTSGPTGARPASGYPLIMLGRHKQATVDESVSRDPTQDRAPSIVRHTSTTLGPLVRIAKLRGDPLKLTAIERLGVRVPYAQPVDKMQLFLQADERRFYDAGVQNGSPCVWDVRGASLHAAPEWDVWIVWQPVSSAPKRCPYISHIMIATREHGDSWEALAYDFTEGMPSDGKERT